MDFTFVELSLATTGEYPGVLLTDSTLQLHTRNRYRYIW